MGVRAVGLLSQVLAHRSGSEVGGDKLTITAIIAEPASTCGSSLEGSFLRPSTLVAASFEPPAAGLRRCGRPPLNLPSLLSLFSLQDRGPCLPWESVPTLWSVGPTLREEL